MKEEDINQKIKRMEKEGLIGFEKDYTGFLLAIATLLSAVLVIVLVWKSKGII